MTERQAEQLKEIKRHSPKQYALFEHVYTHQAPRRGVAIRCCCLDCCCFQVSEAARCTSETCPLWPVNPYRKAKLRRVARSGDSSSDSDDPGGMETAEYDQNA